MFVRQTDKRIWIDAPGKLNLFLEILARRDDGFHEIETLMAPITWFDTLSMVGRDDERIELELRSTVAKAVRRPSDDVPAGEENLVVKAVRRLRDRARVNRGLSIQLVKRIPAAAGLGGASSDAAAALVGANRAWRLGWPRDRLAEVGAELGSDVAFFFAGGAAICRGRGEQVRPLERFPRLDVVVVRPPDGLATADVYRRCRPPSRPRSAADLTESLGRGRFDRLSTGFQNRLQEPARSLSPWIDRLEQTFARFGLVAHQMSGSGTSYFGIARNTREARRVAGMLRALGLGTVFAGSTIATRRPRGEPGSS